MLHVFNHSNEQFRVLSLSRMRYFDTPTQIITAKRWMLCVFVYFPLVICLFKKFHSKSVDKCACSHQPHGENNANSTNRWRILECVMNCQKQCRLSRNLIIVVAFIAHYFQRHIPFQHRMLNGFYLHKKQSVDCL